MMELTLYKSEIGEIRTAEIDGEPWFVAADICKALDIENPRDAVSALDDDEKMTVGFTDGHSGQRGGAQMYNIVSEPGLYKLLFRSNKPKAKEFTRWVTHEVLPEIRKHGAYMTHEYVRAAAVLSHATKDNLPVVAQMLRNAGLDVPGTKEYTPGADNRTFQQKVAALCCERNMTFAEIAKVLGITTTDLRTRFGANCVFHDPEIERKVNAMLEVTTIERNEHEDHTL